MRKTLRTLSSLAVAVLAGLLLTQCASSGNRLTQSNRVFVSPKELVFLRVMPFDSAVKVELGRGGVDPVEFEKQITTELRYRLFSVRRQREATDSMGAQVILTVKVRHLVPGVGATGTSGALYVQALRGQAEEWTEWNWMMSPSSNVSSTLQTPQLVLSTVDQVIDKVYPAPPQRKQPAPAIIPMQGLF